VIEHSMDRGGSRRRRKISRPAGQLELEEGGNFNHHIYPDLVELLEVNEVLHDAGVAKRAGGRVRGETKDADWPKESTTETVTGSSSPNFRSRRGTPYHASAVLAPALGTWSDRESP